MPPFDGRIKDIRLPLRVTLRGVGLLALAVVLGASGQAHADPVEVAPAETVVAEPDADVSPDDEVAVDHEGTFFLSSSAFMLFNLIPFDDPPAFFQANFGIRLSPDDVLIVEAITWQYFHTPGVPYGPYNGNPEVFYPGKVRDIGVGLAYQRFIWRGAYATLHATPFHEQFYDEDNDRFQRGFMLFMTLRAGYHLACSTTACSSSPPSRARIGPSSPIDQPRSPRRMPDGPTTSWVSLGCTWGSICSGPPSRSAEAWIEPVASRGGGRSEP